MKIKSENFNWLQCIELWPEAGAKRQSKDASPNRGVALAEG